jgi:hypothetical protein
VRLGIAQDQRMAIRRRARHRLGPDRAIRAGAIVDDDRLAERARHGGAERAHHDIGQPPRVPRHDDPEGLVGESGEGWAAQWHERRCAQQSAAGECCHRIVPFLVVCFPDALIASRVITTEEVRAVRPSRSES